MSRPPNPEPRTPKSPNRQSSIFNLQLFAHRGASHDAPENTLAAFRLGWQQGADGMECDVYLSRDRRIVCIHDATTQRTAGINHRVASSTWPILRKLDVGRWKGPQWTGERIPLLADVLAELPRGKRIQIEIKSTPKIIPVLVPLLRKVPNYRQRVLVIAFDPRVVRALKRAAPDIRALWLTAYHRLPGGVAAPVTPKRPREGGWRPSPAEIIKTLTTTRADGLGSQSHRALTPTLARTLRTHGFLLYVWTVDHPATARRLARLGATGIATNRPAHLRKGLKEET